MKKILMVLAVLFCVVGCSCKNIKVKVDYEQIPVARDSSEYLYNEYGLVSYELEVVQEYDAKIEGKDSFLLFVYANDCDGCAMLSKAIVEYMVEKPFAMYTINIGKIMEHDLFKTEKVKSTPYLILVEDGKIVLKELMVGEGKLEMGKDAENNKFVKEWLDEHVVWED